VVEIMNAIHAGEITGMYIEGENPAMSDPDLQHAREALAMLDHLVVQDLFVTETAFHADVILPASAFAEKEGSFTNTGPPRAARAPGDQAAGDARQDLWIIQEIGKRMGLPWNYSGPGEVYTEMAQLMPSLKNISWERLVREGAVTYPADDPTSPATRSSSPRVSRPKAAAARSCRPRSSRRTSCPTPNIRWCCRPAACSSTGTRAR
jgi:formate dehydrogenase major subunit